MIHPFKLYNAEFPLRCSGLRIQHCCSCVIGRSCSSDLIPGPEIPICCGCGHKKKKKKKEKEKERIFAVLKRCICDSEFLNGQNR